MKRADPTVFQGAHNVPKSPKSQKPHESLEFQAVVRRDVKAYAGLFDTIERTPLTREQRVAAVTMASRNLLIAAAGSGKTSTMVGKVAYAIQSRLCTPDQILVLAFNRKAASELDERLRRCLAPYLPDGVGVSARTLHALGLDIVTRVQGCRPRVQTNSNDLLYAVLRRLVHHDADFAERWLLFRVFYHVPVRHPDQFESRKRWIAFVRQHGQHHNRQHGFMTLRDELVPTQFEQAVANWLYLYDIDYVYTSLMCGFDTSRPWVWGGIAGIRGKFARPLTGRTGFILKSLKRQLVCLANANDVAHLSPQLISLSLDDFHAGTVFQSLRQHLAGLCSRGYQPDRLMLLLSRLGHRLTPGQVEFLARFIRVARLGGVDSDRFMKRASGAGVPQHAALYVPMLARLLHAYRTALDDAGAIDFEGMLHRAADDLDQGHHRHAYTLILVDEFQDTSHGGLRLLRSMLAQNRACKLFAVGDDWQSIYRFAGAVPDVLSRFEHYFGPAVVNRLTATFRFNQTIADLASRFIQANPAQLRKRVVARHGTDRTSVVLAWYASTAHMYALCEACLHDIKQTASVYILGRYQHQRPRGLERWQKCFPQLDIQYQTVHASKGREADIVIVLGLETGRYGFPVQVPNHALLDVVMPGAEPFPHAEERRLFYVAITRCRRRVYLLASRQQPSPFVTELQAHSRPDGPIHEYGML